MSRPLRWILMCSAVCVTAVISLSAQQMNPTPNRQAGDGEGPFERLVIRGITVIDGTGAPPRGPMDVVVQNNRITDVASVGFPGVADQRARPAAEGREGDRRHRHVPDAGLRRCARALRRRAGARSGIRLQALADARRHGRPRRAVRIDGLGPDQRELSAKNQIVAPRIFSYHRPFSGEGWDRSRPQTPESAREWVRFAAKKGVDGLKLGAHDPEIMAALLDEAKKLNLGRPRTSIRWAWCG